MLLTKNNSKVGKEIWTFSIPAGDTCPGKTATCSSVCYANKHFYVYPSVRKALAERLAASKTDTFVSTINAEIKSAKLTRVRIHASGDFYSAEYTAKWLSIVKANPSTLFVVYTRSWRQPDILPLLRKLANRKNFNLFFSCDADAYSVPRVKNARIAFLTTKSDAEVKIPAHVVFRSARTVPARRQNGQLICPTEQRKDFKTTCDACQLCYDRVAVLDRKVSLTVLS